MFCIDTDYASLQVTQHLRVFRLLYNAGCLTRRRAPAEQVLSKPDRPVPQSCIVARDSVALGRTMCVPLIGCLFYSPQALLTSAPSIAHRPYLSRHRVPRGTKSRTTPVNTVWSASIRNYSLRQLDVGHCCPFQPQSPPGPFTTPRLRNP